MEFQNIRTEAKHNANLEKTLAFWGWFFDYLVLPFNMEAQTQSNWCWAATSTSVSKFYSVFSPWTQCKVAVGELNLSCCSWPTPSTCNVPWYLDKALTRTQNYVSVQSGTISWEGVKQELENGLVIGARIGWNGGGGHFVAIHGVSKTGNVKYLHIDDPIYRKSVITYSQFATNYQGSGTWTHTYFTKKHFYFMWFKELVPAPELLRPIPSVRPLMNVYEETANIRESGPEGAYNLPHHAYIIGLNKIRKDFKLPKEPSTLRVIELQHERPIALFEVGLDETNPELIQMNVSPVYFEQLDEGLGRLRKAAGGNEEKGEIRLIKIPALNLEAFWLHYDGETGDIIQPVKRFENDALTDWEKAYTEKEFGKLVNELAGRIDAEDPLLGA